MADFKQAVQWMREGEKIRRSGLVFDTDYLIMGKEYVRHSRSEEEGYDWKMDDFEATDWEICEEKKESLSEQRDSLGSSGNYWYHEDRVKKSVRRLKKEMHLTFENGIIINKVFGDKLC